jgi:hypothetical protein
MLIQTPHSQAMFTMTGLRFKLMPWNIHNQTSEDQCQLMLIQIQLSLVSSIMTGLKFKLMPNLEDHQAQLVQLALIMILFLVIDSHKITSQFLKCQQEKRKKVKLKPNLNKKIQVKSKRNKKLQLPQKVLHLFWRIDQRKLSQHQRKEPHNSLIL